MDYRSRASFRLAAIWVVLAAVLAGCGVFAPARRPVPFEPPTARRLAPADDPGGFGGGVAMASPVTSDVGMRPPQNVLVLSGGGSFGAFTAGVLAGWTQSGTRPEFDVVTGISTGALLAPFAFIGPDYDARAKHFYTTIRAEDIFTIRSWLTLPFRSAVATSAPLRRLIESEIDQTLMERIAAEHRKGRRLYVGTTNIDTRRLAVWDLGAIACRPCPEGCALFRDVLLASCSIPGMFPPVTFEVDVDGRKATEMHVDGGVSAQVFCPSAVFSAAAAGGPGANLYMVVAGKLYPDAKPVRDRVLPLLAATTSSHVYAHRRGELTNMYGMARAVGMRYQLTALRQDCRTGDVAIKFDQEEMNHLYKEGVEHGRAGRWQPMPPELAPGDGDYIRHGLKLRGEP